MTARFDPWNSGKLSQELGLKIMSVGVFQGDLKGGKRGASVTPNNWSKPWIPLFVCVALATVSGSGVAAQQASTNPVTLDQASARHFLNRFCFGGTTREVSALTGMSPEDAFAALIERSSPPEFGSYVLINHISYGVDQNGNELPHACINGLIPSDRSSIQRPLRHKDKQQFREHLDDWMQGMLKNRDPLRDRMGLFWHGFFPSSFLSTLRSYELIRQNEGVRRLALSNFRELLRFIITDPAMLVYFDNGENTSSHPHENLARELMELYSLGEGNYTERDVREAARALTGFRGETGFFEIDVMSHDDGMKTILGRSGQWDGFDLVEIILDQPACARHLSKHLLSYFEGAPPSEARLAEYADYMREVDYELTPWLEKLATDPRFYSPAKTGTKPCSPIEFIVGTSRRTGIPIFPGFVHCAAKTMGQELYLPPSVRGWLGGDHWITPEYLLMRSLCAGYMTASLTPQQSVKTKNSMTGGSTSETADEYFCRVAEVGRLESPSMQVICASAGAPVETDAALALWALETWLPSSAGQWSATEATNYLIDQREAAEIQEGAILTDPRGEELLRRFANFVVTLPEAHLW